MKRAIDRLEAYPRAIAKAHLAAAGTDPDALERRPLIAVANSWNELCPGHAPLKKLAEEVKKGILEEGGEPLEFNTIALCDGIAQGHAGMRYCLPHREIIADSIEATVRGEGIFDGIVFLAACDKIVPAMLMAAARLDLPAIVVTAGPCFAVIRPSDSKRLRARFLAGEIGERALIDGTLKYYTGPGICPFLGTANTMCALCEPLGMMLSGTSLIPSGTAERAFAARRSGRTVMRMLREGVTPSRLMTREAFGNAITLLAATGGSLNAMLHLPAIAHEFGMKLDWDDFSAVTAKTPVLTDIVPNGDRTVVDLHFAGGIPAVLRELRHLLHTDALLPEGCSMGELLDTVPQGDRSVIRPAEDPILPSDGIRVLYGNLAPRGALVKVSAVPEKMHRFRGPACVFESEEACYAAYLAGAIAPGSAVVVRFEGPKGGPGMKELHRITEIMRGIPGTAVITDGRFSGASGGLSVGYLCPEAADGGPIAAVRDGDFLSIDLPAGNIRLEVPEDTIRERLLSMPPHAAPAAGSLLGRYASMVGSARGGAVLEGTGTRGEKAKP